MSQLQFTLLKFLHQVKQHGAEMFLEIGFAL